MRRLIARALFATTLAVATVAVSAGPAAAHPVSWGWSDNHTICRYCSVRNGNIVKLWQAVLFVDEYYSSSSSIDGDFGPDTQSKTKQFQSHNGLEVDGIVGPETWGHTYSWVFEDSFDTDPTYDYYVYEGRYGRWVLELRKHQSTGEWWFRVDRITTTWTGTSH